MGLNSTNPLDNIKLDDKSYSAFMTRNIEISHLFLNEDNTPFEDDTKNIEQL